MGCKFGYFWNRCLAQRNTGALCPESSGRYEVLSPEKIFNDKILFKHYDFDAFNPRVLSEVHDEEYVNYVRGAYQNNVQKLDARDTLVTEDVFDQALLSASAGCHAVERIMREEILMAFCAVRPPGHHANRTRAMGFCIFNNAAVAARYAQSMHGFKRVMIVDWDVHPGNGTQEIFYEDPTVFTLSFHQENLFAQAGLETLIGRGEGEGFNRNVVLEEDVGSMEYLTIFKEAVEECAVKFKPEFLIIGAGFDAHKNDHVSRLSLSEDDFAQMTRIVLDKTILFTKGRTMSVLEGGYDIAALQASVIAHCKVLAEYAKGCYV